MFNFADLTEGNETLKVLMEEGEGEETSVSIEQKIEVETEVAEEVEVAEEAEESVEEVEEVTEASEAFIAMFDRAEMVMDVIREHGYTKPIAMILNHGQTSEIGGDLERGFGVTLPANESLDVVGSKYDTNVATLEGGFKKTMQNFWAWVQKWAKKIWESITALISRVRAFFTNNLKTANRLAAALKGRKWNAEKAKDKKFKVVSKDNYNKALKVVTDGATSVISAINSVADLDFNGEVKADTISKNIMQALASKGLISITSDGGFKSTNKFEALFKGAEVAVTGEGFGSWVLTDVQNTTSLAGMVNQTISAIDAAKKVKKTLDSIMAASKRAVAGADKDNVAEAKKYQANVKLGIKGVNGAMKALNSLNRQAMRICGEFVKVQRGFVACTTK